MANLRAAIEHAGAALVTYKTGLPVGEFLSIGRALFGPDGPKSLISLAQSVERSMAEEIEREHGGEAAAGPVIATLANLLEHHARDLRAVVEQHGMQEASVAAAILKDGEPLLSGLDAGERSLLLKLLKGTYRRYLTQREMLHDLTLLALPTLLERQAQSQVDVERIRSELELLKTVEPPKIPFSIRAPVPDFRGYEEERAAIRAALAGGNTVNISAVHGMGGAGKSELARKVADEMAADFPDGQILVDMLGTTQQPRTAAEAMTDVLLALGAKAVDPRTLAADYHSRLRGKRLLILLDNVANSAGLDELHPQPPTTLLVTSRTRLAIPGVQSVELERLSRDAAKALLVEIVPRLDDPTSEVLAQLCCDLPLALRVAGAYLDETGASAELYINDLKRRRLHYLARSAGDIERPDLDPRYVLGLSYDRLAETHPAIARIFALLSAFPADFDTAGAAAVVDLGPDKTRRHLAQLTRRSLVQRHGDNRYRLHDLLRELGRQHAPEADVHKACERYIHHYDQLLKTRLLNYFENPDPPKTISEFEHELPHFIHIVLNLIERDSIGATLYAHNLAQMATVVFYFDVAEVCYSICIPGIRSAAAREPQYKGYAATILSNYAPFLHALERNHEALSAIDEAITRYEQIPDVSPEKTFALARAYAIRADCLDSVGSAASARWSNATAIRLLQRVLQNDLANAHFLPLWRDKYREQCARHGVEADVELIAAIEADLTEIKASTGRSLSYN